ncbi:uncharacterized protein VTP21DRAFT_3869 [Calcarisporiella thermophila]|uniref:uncharacterized protein n=1 Tax=Calcarisporiella thermophila TaxID=911321 RepID=UPI0037447296
MSQIFMPKKPRPLSTSPQKPRPGEQQQQQQQGSAPRSFTDFSLRSGGSKEMHHLMRFHSHKPVDLTKDFTPPVRLRRRNPKHIVSSPNSAAGESDGSAVKPDAKKNLKDAKQIAPHGGAQKNRQNLFKKKTMQIFLADEGERELRKREYQPWVLEDDDGQNAWVGSLEGGQKARYMMFVVSEDGFKVVPTKYWYTFRKQPTIKKTPEELEQELKLRGKIMEKADRIFRPGENGEASSSVAAPARGGRRLRLVDHGEGNRWDDDEESKPRREREAADDDDELDFTRVRSDDEEPIDELGKDEETAKKELGQKYKIGQRGNLEEDMDEDETEVKEELTEDGKGLKKLMLKVDKNKAYASEDDEKDPYANLSEEELTSSDEEEFDLEKLIKQEEANSSQSRPSTPQATKPSAVPDKRTNKIKDLKPTSAGLLAKKMVKEPAKSSKNLVKAPTSASFANKPPSTLPMAEMKKRKRMEGGAEGVKVKVERGEEGKKRKRIEPGVEDKKGKARVEAGDATKEVKVKKEPIEPRMYISSPSPAPPASSPSPLAGSPSVSPSASASPTEPSDENLITIDEVVKLLREKQPIVTKDFLHFFKKKLKADPSNKDRFRAIARKVGVVKNGYLSLNDNYAE